MNWLPRGYGGERRSPEAVKREGWREQGVLVISPDDGVCSGRGPNRTLSARVTAWAIDIRR